MAEFQIIRPFAIPTEKDYAAGAALVDEKFHPVDEKFHLKDGPHDGAWYSYHKEAVADIQTKLTVRAFYTNLSSIARLVEPISNDEHKPIDPLFAATHAFRAGMWTSGHVQQHVFEGRIKYEDVQDALGRSLPFVEYSGKNEYEANGRRLMDLGELGLEKVGYETREYIEKWGKEIVYEPSVRQFYALGMGAVTAMYDSIYSAAFPMLQQNYEVSKILSFDALEVYLASNPDSSSN